MNAKNTQQNPLPKQLAEKIGGYDWQENFVGCSTSKVFRLKSLNQNTLYLKTVRRTPFDSILPEKSRLDWLGNKLPVPEVIMFAENEDTEFLLLSEISGVDASDVSLKNNIARTIKQLAAGLKMIQAVPVADCPFDARLDYKIELSEARVKNKLVNESDFDEQRKGRTAEDLFDELIKTKPFSEDLVFTHGDFCLPNIIFKNGKLNGFIDLANAGVADKYQDIALLARSVASNFGAKWTQDLFDAIGIEPDLPKIYFYTLLDEFF